MPLTREETRALLDRALPFEGPRFDLRLADGADAIRDDDNGDLVARLVLSTYDEDAEGARSVRDLKEQEVRLVPKAHRDDRDRAEAFVRASIKSLGPLVEGFFGGEPEMLTPSDLICGELLDDPALRSEAEFAAAIADVERLAQVWEGRDRAQVLEVAESCGIGEHGPALLALRRNSIRIRADELDEDDAVALPVGESRIGGLPDLPRGMEWPRYEDRPLVFLAQIDLSETTLLDDEDLLPHTGWLWFFYDALESKEPNDATWRGGARVIYRDVDRARLVRASPPEHPSMPEPFPAHALTLESERVMPPLETPFLTLLASSPGALHGFGDFLWRTAEWDPERPIHRLLGYATPLQGDPYLYAHVGAIGESFEGWNDAGERERAILRGATEWRLLLQIDSEPDNRLLHQDGGYYYIFIREEALRARRFEEAWGVFQSH
ncbi:YwqG family protein [Polyangium aurulentum]|uniref:YwqG family protein n=1 Tax=Polyangium aurulentum TaxID=2567896 RepID=UPI00146E0B66|nr:YwqG family protein [Polyangium aurulentum]UQA60978.1 DUF1963 domain-containing protein [Polyangium aurulentum]